MNECFGQLLVLVCLPLFLTVSGCDLGDRDVGWSADSRPGQVCPATGRNLYITTEGRSQLQAKQFRFIHTGSYNNNNNTTKTALTINNINKSLFFLVFCTSASSLACCRMMLLSQLWTSIIMFGCNKKLRASERLRANLHSCRFVAWEFFFSWVFCDDFLLFSFVRCV